MIADLKDIKLELTDQTRSDLWAKIRLNTKGMLQEYHRDTLSAEMLRTAEAAVQKYSNSQSGDFSQLTQRVGLLEGRVTVSGLSGIIRNSGNSIIQAIADKGEDIKTAINLDTSGVQIRGDKIHLDGSTFTSSFTAEIARLITLNASQITTGTLNASDVNIINLNANKIVGLDANFIKAKIETAMIDWMRGKMISAQNDAMQIDLYNAGMTFNQDATIDFNSANNALFRQRGTHTAFLHFQDEDEGGVYAGLGVTSSGDGINSKSSGRFAGLRIYRTSEGGTYSTSHEAQLDEVQIFGDSIKLFDDFSRITERGLIINPAELKKVIDFTSLMKVIIACAEMWQHYINAGPTQLSTYIRNRSNSNINKTLVYLDYKDTIIGSV